MTTKNLKDMGLRPKIVGKETAVLEWVADPNWLDLPDITGQDRFVGLVAVNENSTFIAFNVTTSSGPNTVSEGFTVDWGNGTVLDYASGTNVEYLYEFLSTGDYTGVYNQAIISITPKGDDTLLSIDLDVRYTAVTTTHLYSTAWLSIAVASPYLESFNASGNLTKPRMLESVKMRCPNILNYDDMFNNCIGLEYADIDAGNGTSFRYTFAYCSFTKLPNLIVTSAIDLSYMFYNCELLKSATIYAPSATTLVSMFNSCGLLRYVNLDVPEATDLTSVVASSPLLNTLILKSPKAETLSYVAAQCTSLQVVEIDVSSVTSMLRSFYFCTSLTTLPDWDFPLCLDFQYTLSDCTNLLDLPHWTFPQATNLNGMLSSTNILRSPDWEYPSVTSVYEMFSYCSHLIRLEAYFPSITNPDALSRVAAYAYDLQEIIVDSAAGPPIEYGHLESLRVPPLVTLPVNAEVRDMFRDCHSILEIPAIDCANAISLEAAFTCDRLIRCRAFNIGVNVSFTDSNLAADAIDEIFTNLASVTSAYIRVSGTPGAGTCDTTIATAKGWTVYT